jgi:hypothetical protein
VKKTEKQRKACMSETKKIEKTLINGKIESGEKKLRNRVLEKKRMEHPRNPTHNGCRNPTEKKSFSKAPFLCSCSPFLRSFFFFFSFNKHNRIALLLMVSQFFLQVRILFSTSIN